VTEPGHRNDIDGAVNGPVLQARTVTAHTIIMQGSAGPPMPTPRQFPPPHPVWTNRGRELAVLDELAATSRPTRALLTGLGGIGKTELAVRWLTGQRAGHPDGELYADLSAWRDQPPARPHQVLAGWLRALGVPRGDLPATLSELTGLYRSVTAEKSLLVLVDNAFSADQVRPLIPASPSSTILATSHQPPATSHQPPATSHQPPATRRHQPPPAATSRHQPPPAARAAPRRVSADRPRLPHSTRRCHPAGHPARPALAK
jgi:hypothetical protein